MYSIFNSIQRFGSTFQNSTQYEVSIQFGDTIQCDDSNEFDDSIEIDDLIWQWRRSPGAKDHSDVTPLGTNWIKWSNRMEASS